MARLGGGEVGGHVCRRRRRDRRRHAGPHGGALPPDTHGDNRLYNDGVWTYSYDPSGNRTQKSKFDINPTNYLGDGNAKVAGTAVTAA